MNGAEAPGHVSLVMLARNRLSYTRRCVESLDATRGSFEWVIVDNGSTDGTPEFLRDWARTARHDVRVIANAGDPGCGRARNQGAARAAGELLVFLDNDLVLDEVGWLQELLRPLSAGMPGLAPEAIVAASPLLLFPGPDGIVQCAGGAVTATGRFGLLRRGEPELPAAREHRREAWAPAAALLVRRSAFAEVQGFDESFDPVALCEDVDLCCRLRALGGEIAFVGSSRLRHFEGTTFDHLGLDKFGYWCRQARIVKNRWLEVLTRGPLHPPEEIAWRPIIKEYADLACPRVRPATGQEAQRCDLSFFSSGASLGPTPVPDVRVGVIGCGQVARKGAFPGLSRPGSGEAAGAAPFLSFDGAPGVVSRRRATWTGHVRGPPRHGSACRMWHATRSFSWTTFRWKASSSARPPSGTAVT